MIDLKIRLNADLSVKAVVKDEDEILASVISAVSDERIALLAESAADGSLFDETELFHRCFAIEWDDTFLSGIEILPDETMAEGDAGISLKSLPESDSQHNSARGDMPC